MSDLKIIAESLNAIIGYSWPSLVVLATWLWERGARAISPEMIARDCPVVKPDQAPLAYRLLIRAGALREGQAGQGAQVEVAGLITLLVQMGQLLRPEAAVIQPLELAWTLPAGLHLPHAIQPQRSILDLIRSVINSAQERLWLVSPFINEAGLEQIFEPTISALRRGVNLIVITHYLQDLSSSNSRAVERLQREAAGLGSQFHAYTSREETEGDEVPHPLLHTKIVVADGKRGYLGTANLTGYGLRSHLEIGVGLGELETQKIEQLLKIIVVSRLVEKARG